MSELSTLEIIQSLSQEAQDFYAALLSVAGVQENSKRKTRVSFNPTIFYVAFRKYRTFPQYRSLQDSKFYALNSTGREYLEELSKNLLDANLLAEIQVKVKEYQYPNKYLVFKLDNENNEQFKARLEKIIANKTKQFKIYHTVSASVYRQQEVRDKEKEIANLLAERRRGASKYRYNRDVLTNRIQLARTPLDKILSQNKLDALEQARQAENDVIAQARQELKSLKQNMAKEIRKVAKNSQVMGL